MPKTVWKYEWPQSLDVFGNFSMPKGAEILSLQDQFNRPCLWALVDPDQEQEQRQFELCGTGTRAPDGKYIGTCQYRGGALVLHCFETTKR